MPKANEVARELRMLADALDVNPMLEIVHPSIYFNHGAKKGTFVDLAKILPRPLRKRVGRDDDPYSACCRARSKRKRMTTTIS